MAQDLRQYLDQGRDAVLRGLDGLSEYDARRPLTPTGSNVLGLVKHLTGCERIYLGESVGRPYPQQLPWVADGSIWDGADMWVTAEESREYILGLYAQARRHSDESLAEVALDAPASVSHWPEDRRQTTFGHLVVRMVAETAQHAGHIDILRESIDGRGGPDRDDVGDDATWQAYVERIQRAAELARSADDRSAVDSRARP